MPRSNAMMGQKPAVLADGDDLAHDELGVTNPNLHRRIEMHNPPEGELKSRTYMLGIYGVNSYRTTEVFLHSEDSDDSEVP